MHIVFYTRGLPFDGGSLEEKSLGGAETALICLAREFAHLGHQVQVFCPCPRPGEYDGVQYLDLADFPRFAEKEECEAFICSRFLEGLAAPLRAQVYVLWNHDVLLEEVAPAIHSLMYRIDALFCLSEFQKEHYRRLLEIPADRFVLTRNGIDLGMIEEATAGVERERARLLYTSRPERGLKVLLDVWPRLKERRPDLSLGVAWYENPGADAEMRGFLENLKSQISDLEGVEFLGGLTKRELYRQMARARVWVYPSIFPEISCISAIEAAACGTPAVASRYCALKETIVDGETGLLVSGPPGSEEYARRFEEAVFSLLDDETRWEKLSGAGRARVAARYQWSQIAEEWQEWLEESLRVKESRVQSRPFGSPRVCESGVKNQENPRPMNFRLQTPDPRLRDSVSCCMIVKDAEGTLHRCLKSVRPWVEELIVCDTGSTDSTREIARQYADVMKEIPWEEDFGEARNRSIEGAGGDWILWIDADEYLVGGENLAKYLRDNMYNGYVIRQHHQALDAEFKPDVPVRLFRNHRGIRFFGVIHEHPEQALNQGIHPAVILSDVHIVHDGYITEKVRRERFLRNLPLLLKDREKYPDRRLGLVFLARDYLHLARYEMEKNRGQLTERAARFLEKAAAIHKENFANPADPLYVYSFPLYQTALALLDAGVEVAWYLGPAQALASRNGEPQPRIQRCRFMTEQELWESLGAQVKRLFRQPERQFAFE